MNSKKRVLDLTLAVIALVPALAISLAAALAIWIEDRGNPWFVQQRVGREGQGFRLIKLRTMRVGTGDRPSHETAVGSITRIGAFLRRTKIDELPQILNVLKGEMSFVGPRPGLFTQTRLTECRRALGVDRLTPGITGPGQVAGLDMSQPERLAKADAEYLRAWSVRRDLQLLWATATGKGRGDAAVRTPE